MGVLYSATVAVTTQQYNHPYNAILQCYGIDLKEYIRVFIMLYLCM